MKTPLADGFPGLGNADATPAFEQENPGPFLPFYRRWPAAVRVLAREDMGRLPVLSEVEVFVALRRLASREQARSVRTVDRMTKPEPERSIVAFLQEPKSKLGRWWSSAGAWRSPREFASYGRVEGTVSAPHLEPYEIAHRRLTDDISCDHDVVVFVAWCQGVSGRDVAHDEILGRYHQRALRAGLRKLQASPWTAFSLAAPFMAAVGVMFRGASYFDACARMAYLLDHPLEATDGELEQILQTPAFRAAYAKARKARKRGAYVNPAGQWYVGGRIESALGASLRRGALHLGQRGAR